MILSSEPAKTTRPHGGFTLIEVLVAVAVVALGLAGILATINGMLGSSAYLRDKTLANWVAQNHAAELRLDDKWPSIGKTTDDVDMAGQRWHVSTEVVATPAEKLRRADISVAYRETPDEPLVTVATFIGEPQPLAPQADWRGGVPEPSGARKGSPDDDGSAPAPSDEKPAPPGNDNGGES